MGKGKRKRNKEGIPKEGKGALSPAGKGGRAGTDFLVVIALAFAAFLVYSNTLKGPFIFDSELHIQDDPAIHLHEITVQGIKKAAFHRGKRPVSRISFALNYYFSRDHVAQYRFINILIHSLTAVLFFFLIRTTLGLPPLRERYRQTRWIPFLAALIWLLHPIQTQSVTYVIQRMNSMAAMFFVLSLLLYARARMAPKKMKRLILFSGCLVAGLLALGSKQTAATLPFVLFLYEWYFFRDLDWTWIRRRIVIFTALVIALAVLAVLFARSGYWQKIIALYDLKDFTPSERLLTEARVVIFYLSLLILPHPSRLNLDHEFTLSHSILNPVTTLFALIILAGLLLVAILTAKRYRLLSFCLLWFLGNLVIESTFIPLALLYEHRLYLPSMGLCLIAVILAHRWLRPVWARIGAACLVVLVFSVWTFQRNAVWTDDLVFWKDVVSKSPNKEKPHLNLGAALRERGRMDEAAEMFREAMRLDPKDEKAPYNLAVVLERQGKEAEAVEYYSKAIRLKPDFVDAHNNLGIALASQGKYDEAITHYREALRINPRFARAYNSLGYAFEKQGNLDEAIQNYQKALQLDPDYATACYNLAGAFARHGNFERAVQYYIEALRLNPRYPRAHYNLGVVLLRQGKTREAAFHFSEALRIDPDDVRARRALQLLSRRP